LRFISRFSLWALLAVTVILPSCGEGYINNPVPVLNSLTPDNENAQSPQFTLTLVGNYFTPSSTVEWSDPSSPAGAQALQAIFQDVQHMTAIVPAGLLQNPGLISVSVFTPQPGGGTSIAQTFTINPRPSPIPTITAISPTVADVGSSTVTVTITGTGFVSQSVVEINGTNLTTTVNTSTSIQVTLPASEMTTAGPLPLVVLNPPPGGGASNTYNLELDNPIPRISSISPTGVTTGTAETTMTLTGTGFTLTSELLVNGTPVSTTPGGDTGLTGQIPASFFAGGSVLQISVLNPAPGGGTSNIVVFPVNATTTSGLPQIVDLAPDGSQAISGICGTMANCTSLVNGLEPLTTSGPSVSQTGEFVVFASISDNLVLNDASPQSQIFFRDTCFGGGATCVPLTTIASVDPNGNAADGPSAEPSTDTGGAHVAFSSMAQNLVTGIQVTGKYRQVYWTTPCKTATGCTNVTTELVSESADGSSEGNGDSYNPVISPDGRYVAFVSLATNLASNVNADGITPQVYVTDTCDGVASAGCFPTTYLVSTADGTTPGNAASSHPSVSNSGQYVAFTSTASNLGSQAPNPQRAPNVFVREICYATPTSCTPTTTTLASTPDGQAPANGTSDSSAISSDGRFIAFESTATNLIIGDGPTQQIYVRDTCLTNTVSTTCSPATYLVSTTDGTTPGNGLSENPSMSSSTSGQFIAFASQATNLSPNTANGIENIFARNTCLSVTVTTTNTCAPLTVLVSQPAGTQPPPANGNSMVPAIASEGHTVAFFSFSSNLIANDLNGANGIGDMFLGTTTF